MTRAREHLHLLVPQRFYVTQQAGGGDKHVYAGRSRFITQEMLEAFEQIAWPDAAAAAPLATGSGAPALLQVRERSRAAWR
jgi:DNA helicase-2/ATP-dependent DNA helicase PcrA